jgi:hypothetical protein
VYLSTRRNTTSRLAGGRNSLLRGYWENRLPAGGSMRKTMVVGVVLIGVGILSWSAFAIYKSQHTMSRDFLVRGRLALEGFDRVHESDASDNDLANARANMLYHDAAANRANSSDKLALTALQNYATVIGYVHIFPKDSGFCAAHHCQQLYEICKSEMKMFDSGFVPSTSQCRDISAEDK